ncbi:MAG TPA: protein kinase [Paludibaculum sp.]|jgi:serine/threonine-protein kinase
MNYDIGSRIGDYEILQILGAGGMGKVFKVRNVISDRVEAMKVLLPNLDGNTELADRFIREIKVQASLNHPNIANLHTALSIDNQLIMLMEYVEGQTLDIVVKDGPLPLAQMTGYAMQALEALAYAHGKGIVHRDLKPSNMMVSAQGQLKLLDFGIAKLTTETALTKTGLTVGSIYYMSPEQIQGAATLDARADLYSFGICLYELFTARRPFEGDSEYSIMAAHLQQVPVPPIERDPRLPSALNDVILMAIEKDPAKRFQSAGAMLGALRAISGGMPAPVAAPQPVRAPSAPPPPPPAYAAALPPPPASLAAVKPTGRRGLYMALGALAAVGVIVVAAIEIPKRMKTEAQGAAPIEASAPAQSTPVQPSSPAEPAPTSQPHTEQAAQTQPAVTPPGKAYTGQPAARPAGAASSFSSAPAANAQPNQSQFASQAPSQPAQSAPPQSAPAQSSLAPNPADAARQASLAETREHLMLLGTRAVAVKTSINNLRAEQQRMGLGLRSDISGGLQRMEYFLDQTEDALKRGDADAAKKNLSNAERETGKLESFLGR